MRTSHEIIRDICQNEGQEAGDAFKRRVLHHANRFRALACARRFLSGIEMKPFEPNVVGGALTTDVEPEKPRNRTERILACLAQADRPLANRDLCDALGIKNNDCAATLTYLRDIGKIEVVGEAVVPPGRKVKLYALPRKVAP